MGLLDRFRPAKIEAQLAPPLMTDSFNYFLPLAFNPVGREEAISVPSVARCRNLIAGTIATFPLCLYKRSTGEKLGKPAWLEQPAASQPLSVTLAWTVDSLLFLRRRILARAPKLTLMMAGQHDLNGLHLVVCHLILIL
jgi:hypothetical protein